jgi:hypothetical protein
MLLGYSQYFKTNSQMCQYGTQELALDGCILAVVMFQILMYERFHRRYAGEWDPVMLILRAVCPLYCLYALIYKMECLDWGRFAFACFVCFGIVMISNNSNELKRGIKRDEEGEYSGQTQR